MSVKALLAISLAMVLGSCKPAHADPLDYQDMLRAIIGEAEGEPYAGKVALAYALRNRGKMSGVYGHKAISLRSGAFWRGSRRISASTVDEARNAWNRANSYPSLDPTKGAQFWENIKAFGTPYWASSMIKTARIGNHVFYKEG